MPQSILADQILHTLHRINYKQQTNLQSYITSATQAIFTAVKRKNLRHFWPVGALKFESAQKFTSAKFVWKRAEHVPANRISRLQNLCMAVTSFPTHTQRKKLKFSESA